jgi:transposase InsO family protein
MTNGDLEEREISLQGMTFIDPATGWFEIAEVPAADKTSARISRLFDQVWLSRYPRPRKVLYDNGSEFKKDFQPLVKDFAVKATCTSIKNPQSNAILERIHQVVGSMLKTKDLVNIEFDELDMWNPILASVAYAIRCSHHSTLNATPGQLIFGRDMLLDLKFEPNYKQMWAHKQKRITYDNVRENSKRISHDYKVDEYAYILKDGQYRKLEGDKQGPFRITEVFSNGTVRLQKGVVNERLNIRRLTPHFGEPPNQDMV